METSLSYIVVLVLALSMSHSPIANSLFNKFSVHIVNGFNNQTLEAHCKSGDDDLGLRHVPVHQEFMWKFRVNFRSSTLFFCNMWWNGGHKFFDVFKADEAYLAKYCGYDFCRWQGREDGIYAYNGKHKEYIFAYKWD